VLSHSDLQKVIRGGEVPPGFNPEEANEGREVEKRLKEQIKSGQIPEGIKNLHPQGRPVFNPRLTKGLSTQSGEINLSATPDILFTGRDEQLAVEVKKRGKPVLSDFYQGVLGKKVLGDKARYALYYAETDQAVEIKDTEVKSVWGRLGGLCVTALKLLNMQREVDGEIEPDPQLSFWEQNQRTHQVSPNDLIELRRRTGFDQGVEEINRQARKILR